MMHAGCVEGSGRLAVKLGYILGFLFCGPVMDYSNSVFWLESVFRFVLFMCKPSTKSSISVLWHVVQSFRVKCIRSHPHHLNAVHFKLDWLLLSSSPYFLSRWLPRRGKCQTLCQRCLASSNICEVLSSSPQLRRTLSQDSWLLTRNTAKTVKPSALKRIHSACLFASTKYCIIPKFVVFKAALSPCCRGPCNT